MNFTKTMFALAIGSVGIVGAMSAHAVAVNNGDTLTINSGVTGGPYNFVQATGGSWFGMDNSGDGTIAPGERVKLEAGANGIVIGAVTSIPANQPLPLSTDSYHNGNPNGTEALGPIVKSWAFFNSTGTNFNTVAITGSTEAGLNFSGWNVAWNEVDAINMGNGAWGTGFSNGVAKFSWSGVYGTAYSIDYAGTVPLGDPSNFGGVKYYAHFEGVVNAAAPVPEASTYGMMLAGLGLVGFAVRRRKSAI